MNSVRTSRLQFSDLISVGRIFYFSLQPVSLRTVGYLLASRILNTYVARIGKRVVGFYQIRESDDRPGVWLDYLAVDSRWKGTSVAKFLLQDIIYRSQCTGNTVLYLSVHAENLRAIRFYEKNGFVLDGRQTDAHKPCMKLTLTPIESGGITPLEGVLRVGFMKKFGFAAVLLLGIGLGCLSGDEMNFTNRIIERKK